MKLLKTIKNIIQESEEQYNRACELGLPIEELDKLEKHYIDSLKLLKLYKKQESEKPKK
jgi:acyl carrier protein